MSIAQLSPGKNPPEVFNVVIEIPANATPVAEVEELALGVAKAAGEKCARCWIYSTELGTNPAYPDTCPRCTSVLLELGE